MTECTTPTNRYSLKRGDTLALLFVFATADDTPLDLSGCTARAQLRTGRDQIAASFTTDDGSLVIEPARDDAPLTGRVALRAEAETTAQLALGLYTLDLELTFADGTVRSTPTLFVELAPDVTR